MGKPTAFCVERSKIATAARWAKYKTDPILRAKVVASLSKLIDKQAQNGCWEGRVRIF